MTAVMTEDFPYTLGYATELLGLEDQVLLPLAESLAITPKLDERTGNHVFTYHELELLKRAADLFHQGKTLPEIHAMMTHATAKRTGMHQPEMMPTAEDTSSAYLNRPASRTPMAATSRPEGITVVVEAVSQAKEGILKDMSRLLDDKLAGLDEVVVELIRCKSENDTLRQKMQHLIEQKEQMEHELSRFRPVQFGFYRKIGE